MFEVRDRSSGSDFWYVRRLHGLGDGKREGWVKAKHLVPYHGMCVRACVHARLCSDLLPTHPCSTLHAV